MKRIFLLAAACAGFALPAGSQTATNYSPPPTAPAASDLNNALRDAQERLRATEAERAKLEAKLKEALAAQPAAIDPRELARAEERIRVLQKENESLRTSIAQAVASPAASTADLEKLRREMAETKRKLDAQSNAAVLLLAEANTKIDQLAQRADTLALERDGLRQRLAQLGANAPETGRLATENAELRRQLATAGANATPELKRQLKDTQTKLAAAQKSLDALAQEKTALEQRSEQAQRQAATGASTSQELTRQLKDTQTKLAAAQKSLDALAQEKTALERRAEQAQRQAATTAAADAKRIQKLERERDELQGKLTAANRDLASSKGKPSPASLKELNNQVLALRAKLDVFGAKTIPYTPEELALFKKPEPRLVTDNGSRKKPLPKVPVATAVLVADADRRFATGAYPKAEEAYQQVVQKDDKDLRALCNLATTQAAENHLDAAEQTIQKALALAPNDPASLGVLGFVKYNQTNYDAALESLGRATKTKPQDAGLQNLLGMTLVQKGQRGPAETAFRKALQVDPAFPDAHRNLATIYLTQKPPLKELARWHYQKALAAGHPHVPAIEKALEDAPAETGK